MKNIQGIFKAVDVFCTYIGVQSNMCCAKTQEKAYFLKRASLLEDWCVLEQMCTGANTGFL